ncbi:MAG: hypothetical protein BWY77_00517 [bacterium ADurb.Bin431]|nr:MAG: hypothetical protein BWY77_00517 [bacterium ADurb.Bin431]
MRLDLLDIGRKAFTVQFDQKLTLLHGIPLLDVDLFNLGGDAGSDLDVGYRLDFARPGNRPADIPPFDLG